MGHPGRGMTLGEGLSADEAKPERGHKYRQDATNAAGGNKGYLGSGSPYPSQSIHSLQPCPTLLQPCGLETARLPCPRGSPGKKTGVGCYVLLQGSFPTQGWKLLPLSLLHWQLVLQHPLESPSPPLVPPKPFLWKHLRSSN